MFDEKLLESAELYSYRYKNFATLIILPVVVFVIFLVGFLCFANKELTVTGVGTVQPIKVIAQIQSTSNNPILENNLAEGKIVANNTLLLKYNGKSNAIQLESLNQQLLKTQNQQKSLTFLQDSIDSGINKFSQPDNFGYYQEYQNYLAQIQTITDSVNKANQTVDDQNSTISNEQSVINKQISILNQQIGDYQDLQTAVSSNKTVDSHNQYISQFNNYQNQVNAQLSQKESLKSQFLSTIQSNITQLQAQVQSLTTQLASIGKSNAYDNSLSAQLLALKAQELQKTNQSMQSLAENISDLSSKISLQKQADAEGALYAPSKGILHVLPKVLGLKMIATGTPIAELYPELVSNTKIYVTTYVSSSDIAAIKLGQTMRLSVKQNLPTPVILSGKITDIDSAPSVENGLNMFEIKAEVKIHANDLSKIRYGLQGSVVVITGKKTYFNYYKDKILGES
ncbi:bacteriocin secretion accessory protein [Lactococcus hircilactis]|uniref:Bacteriocin secretion accessory protein n=1 Tax=Lactococcus hircilactis TaxID=1494462 RepID=A0A7X1Z6F1_9LACT|nr:bacteriocin secretion accessory protein [Lactococcus hircilactis]MQW38343.1 bacteriocin secretion accessory protein [Lactococcus hircilactis]